LYKNYLKFNRKTHDKKLTFLHEPNTTKKGLDVIYPSQKKITFYNEGFTGSATCYLGLDSDFNPTS